MPVTLQLAMKLQKLRHLTIDQAAERLNLPVAEIEEACRMLTLPMAHEPEPPRELPTDAEREAMLERMPKKMQDRIRKAKGGK